MTGRLLRRAVILAALVVPLGVGVESAGAARECDGHMVCVPVAGPWVSVPAGSGASRARVEYQLTCPRGHVVGGLDAELSTRAIDVSFLGRLGSPVNPGVSTRRSAVFQATFVGGGARSATFRPHIGCIPAAGSGVRVPTSVTQLQPGEPVTRRVRTVRVRPGARTVTVGCTGAERLVGASHAFGFFRRTPPGASLVGTVSGTRDVSGRRVVVRARGDAELGGVRAVVQVHALCARVR